MQDDVTTAATAGATVGPKPTCRTCPYWSEKGGRSDEMGECRHHAPRWTPDCIDWAPVQSDQWCGDHPDFPTWLATARQALPDASSFPDKMGDQP